MSVDLLGAVMITALLRQRVGHRVFRFVHRFTYGMWPIAVVHPMGNGTNGTSSWFLWLVGVSTISVAIAIIWRLSSDCAEHSSTRQRAIENTDAS